MIDREALYKRCRGNCEKCGGGLPDNWAAHHRKLRKHGGPDSLDNVIALHHECHNLGTDSVHLNPKRSREMGWLVSAYADPTTAPMWLPFEGWVLLSTDGTYAPYKEGTT